MENYTDDDIRYAKAKKLTEEEFFKKTPAQQKIILDFVKEYEANTKDKRVVQGAVEGSGAGTLNRVAEAQLKGWQKVYGDTPEGYGQYVKELYTAPMMVAGVVTGVPSLVGAGVGAGLAKTGLDVPLGNFLNKNKGMAVASEVAGVIGGGKAIPTAFKQPLGLTISRKPLSRLGQMAKDKGVRATQSSENVEQGIGDAGKQARIASDVNTRQYHQQFMDAQKRDLERVAKGLSSEAGKTTGEAFGSASDLANQKMSRLFSALEKSEEMIGDVTPNKAGAIATQNLDGFLASNDVAVKGFKPLRKSPTLSSTQISAVKEIQNKIKGFTTPEDIRRFLRYEFDELYGKKIFDVAPNQMKEAVRKMQQVRSAILDAMYETIPDPKIRARVKKARDAYHEHADSILLNKMMEADSVDTVFRNKVIGGGLPAIKEAQKIYGSKMVSDLGVVHLIEEATKTGTFNFDAFKRAYDALRTDKKRAIFGDRMKDVDDFIALGEYAQGKKLFEATGTSKGNSSPTAFVNQLQPQGEGSNLLNLTVVVPMWKWANRGIKTAMAKGFLNAGAKGKLTASDISLPYTGRMGITKGVEGASAPFEEYATNRLLQDVEKRKKNRNK